MNEFGIQTIIRDYADTPEPPEPTDIFAGTPFEEWLKRLLRTYGADKVKTLSGKDLRWYYEDGYSPSEVPLGEIKPYIPPEPKPDPDQKVIDDAITLGIDTLNKTIDDLKKRNRGTPTATPRRSTKHRARMDRGPQHRTMAQNRSTSKRIPSNNTRSQTNSHRGTGIPSQLPRTFRS